MTAFFLNIHINHQGLSASIFHLFVRDYFNVITLAIFHFHDTVLIFSHIVPKRILNALINTNIRIGGRLNLSSK
jgi:hypothetical protein